MDSPQDDFEHLIEKLETAMLSAKRLELAFLMEILRMALLEAQEQQSQNKHGSPPIAMD